MTRVSLKRLWPRGGLWRQPDFLKLWGGQTISEFGTQVTLLALPTVAVNILHASAFAVAALTIFEQLPFLLFALPAGVWVDRLRRRPLLIVGDAGRALALASVPIAYAFHALHMWQLFAVAFATGVLTVFFDVSYQSYLPSLVGREHLVDANSKLEISASGAQTGGPGLAGLFMKFVSPPYAIVADAVSFVASSLFVLGIRKHEGSAHTKAPRRRMRTELAEGLRYVVHSRYLRPIALCTATRNFFAAVGYAILLVYAYRTLGLSVFLVGVMISCANVGFVIGAFTAKWITRELGIGRTIVLSAAVVGSSIAFIPLAPRAFPVPMFVFGLMLYSFGGVVFNITQVSFRQTITPDRLQGRMNSVMRFVVWGAIPLGALLGGAVAATWGLRQALFVSAGGIALSWLFVFFSPVRALREVPPIVEPELAVPLGASSEGLVAHAERTPADA